MVWGANCLSLMSMRPHRGTKGTPERGNAIPLPCKSVILIENGDMLIDLICDDLSCLARCFLVVNLDDSLYNAIEVMV